MEQDSDFQPAPLAKTQKLKEKLSWQALTYAQGVEETFQESYH